MSSSTIDRLGGAALRVRVNPEILSVDLADGRTISAPLVWYPRLSHATQTEREDWRLTGGGAGIHWPQLDEDLSVESLLLGRASAESAESLSRWLASRAAYPVSPSKP